MVLKIRRYRNTLVFICIIIILIIFFRWQNNSIVITNHEYRSTKLPSGFDNFTIVQISDLHNKDFHGELAKKVKEINPDIVVITGDLIDRRNTRIDIAVEFTREIVKIAPIYYVSGNHEQLSGEYNILKDELQMTNVQIIDNSQLVLNKNGDEIGIMGIADPAIHKGEDSYLWDDSIDYVKNSITGLLKGTDNKFNILLSHRPEQFNVYKDMKMDLVFSGHAHGGQIRIPFIGGLVAPNQGLFPEYTEGIYRDGSTSMVVSRGLGNSIIPFRIFNRPELVVVTLKK